MAIQGAMQVQIPASAVGANGYTFTINWPLAGVDLTTADTLSGNIRLTETGDPFPISGVLTATGANELTWKLHSSDTLTQGTAEVQFRATFGTDNIISAPSKWLIYNTLSGALPPPDPSVVSFIRNNGDGTYSFLNAADFRTAIGAGTGDGDMPLIDPAVAGNLAIQAADGSLVDAGYAADVNPTAGSVVRRGNQGQISSAATSGGSPSLRSFTTGGASALQGYYDNVPVFSISGLSGVYRFLGAGAVANRGAQRTELGLGTAAVADATAFDAAGSAAGVQGNLDTHTGDATIHFTQAAISITPAQAGADPAGSAAGVQGNLDTHTGLTGTAVHGLGTAALLNSTDVGEDLVEAVDVDGAREVLGLSPENILQNYHNFVFMDWIERNIAGSGTASNVRGAYLQANSGATANSTASFAVDIDNLYLNGSPSFDWTKKILLGARIGFSTNTASGRGYIFFGKSLVEAYGLVASGNYIAIEINARALVAMHVCRAGTIATEAIAGHADIRGANITINHNNGTAQLSVNGIVTATTTSAPNTNVVGTVYLDADNGAVAANYTVRAKMWALTD